MSLIDTPLAAGKYTLEFYPTWVSGDVRDYSIVIDSPKSINILDK
jgi:hypothetical protein